MSISGAKLPNCALVGLTVFLHSNGTKPLQLVQDMKLSFQDKPAVMTEKDTIRHKEALYSNRIQISLEIKKKNPRKLPLVKYGILS